MAEVPFGGKNPFRGKNQATGSQPSPTGAHQAKQTMPPPARKTNKEAPPKKRQGGPSDKPEATKKARPSTEGSSSAVVTVFR